MLINNNLTFSNESSQEKLIQKYNKFHQTLNFISTNLPTVLFTQGLDNEQIWQQIQLINNHFITSLPQPIITPFLTENTAEIIPAEDDTSSVDEIIRKSTVTTNLSEEEEDNFNFSENSSSEGENSEDNVQQDQAAFEQFEKEADLGLSSEEEDLLYDTAISEVNDQDELTAFQKQQKQMSQKIEEVEKKALQPSKWQMKGEVTATSRPINSLVEENLKFDYSAIPPAPVTLESNQKLEDTILDRIRNKIYDDVERKVKSIDKPFEYAKEAPIEQEKSKKSLAEIYEESRANSANISKSESEKKTLALNSEIRSSLNSLFSKLNAMSSFFYSPASTQSEAVVVNNMAALYAEEKGPIATSTETGILAPEEITNKRTSGRILGKDERTETDKKRERRKKKVHQHYRLNPKEDKPTKNTIKNKIAVGNSKAFKSSTALFSTLESNKTIEAVKRKKSSLVGNPQRKTVPASKKLKL